MEYPRSMIRNDVNKIFLLVVRDFHPKQYLLKNGYKQLKVLLVICLPSFYATRNTGPFIYGVVSQS